jgi:outer membrane biosynthesis protein TonB
LLNRLAKDKSLRLLFVGFFLFLMVWQPTPAYAGQAIATITCADSTGNQQSFATGWNNENNYFMDKGNIPQHFCEGGWAGQFTSFVGVVSSDGTELDSALLYHPGYIAPSPVNPPATDEALPQTETTVRSDDVERTDETATADVARTEEVVREPEPVAPVAPIAPEPSPEPTPTATPEPEPTPESPVRPVEPTTPPEVITPTPEPSEPSTSPTEPQIPTEPAPELPEPTVSIELALEAVSKLVDNLRSIGSDLTPEVREQAQQVIVASVIVTQVALAGRKP